MEFIYLLALFIFTIIITFLPHLYKRIKLRRLTVFEEDLYLYTIMFSTILVPVTLFVTFYFGFYQQFAITIRYIVYALVGLLTIAWGFGSVSTTCTKFFYCNNLFHTKWIPVNVTSWIEYKKCWLDNWIVFLQSLFF